MIYSTLLKGLLRIIYGKPPQASGAGPEAGMVFVLDGVGKLDLMGTSLLQVAPTAGVAHAIRRINWGHGWGRWLADLTNVSNHTAQAAALAAQVEAFRAERPGAPVYLVGKSGGTGILVWALEHLPPNAVEMAVLVAPALSPRYDLSRALRAVRTEMVVFWSPLDVFILGLGTLLLGTIDRVRSPSAGLVGFKRPAGLDVEAQAQYAKLRQVRWHPRMAPTFYLGGHVGPDSPFFLRKYVVPLLLGSAADAHARQCQARAAQGR